MAGLSIRWIVDEIIFEPGYYITDIMGMATSYSHTPINMHAETAELPNIVLDVRVDGSSESTACAG